MIQFVFPTLALAAEGAMKDLAPSRLVAPSLFLVMLFLSLAVAFLPDSQSRARRSLALLTVLTGMLGLFTELLPLALGTGVSLALFLGIFGVIYAMGKFDAP